MMRLALVHDYLIQMGGAERVVAAMAEAFPEAPIYTSATKRSGILPQFSGKTIVNSWADRVPGLHDAFKKFFPIYPFAFRSFKPVDADVVWISSSGFAKWIRVGANAKTICYCHTPPRFFWNSNGYVHAELGKSLAGRSAKALLPSLRRWDFLCAQQIDRFVANSRCVQRRIWECYGRPSTVIHPPVDVDRFAVQGDAGTYYLILSRLIGYKRIDLAIEACNRLGERLIVIGEGPDRARLEALAGPSISFLGRLSDDEINRYLERCRALIFPGLEDFGIAAVEVQACGRPVIAFAGGGALETVIPGETGLLFQEQTVDSLVEAIERSKALDWSAERIRANATQFSREVFLEKMRAVIEAAYQEMPGRLAEAEGKVTPVTERSYGL
jgi:glycosyltransferase involved in cell wall biosynthesis